MKKFTPVSPAPSRVTDSLRKCGITDSDINEIGEVVMLGADETMANLERMKPLQKRFDQVIRRLPTVPRADKDGNPLPPVVDESSPAFKDFIKIARNFAIEKVASAATYCRSYVKRPDAHGVLAWFDLSLELLEDGSVKKWDAAVYRHFSVTGQMIKPGVPFKTDDPHLIAQVIKPLRSDMETNVNTTMSRLRTKIRGAGGGSDLTKRMTNLTKSVNALWTACQKEDFPVQPESELKAWLAQLPSILGMGVKASAKAKR